MEIPMNHIRSRVTALIVAMVMLFSITPIAASEPPEITAGAALLIDADTGDVLFGKNETLKMYPASTTKIMVALLALENLELDEIVTANSSALGLLPPGHTNIGIKNGEQLTVRQLLYALMLPSAGDAANVLGERISGSVDEFVKLMNSRALELGMTSTSYMNASGAHDELHYTTALDTSLLAREVMKNETFREIVKTDVYIIPATEQYPEERRLLNTNHLVSKKKTSKYYYEYATGIKTGFTNPAKRCLVSSATKGDLNLICVVFGADVINNEQMDFVESRALLEYGYSNFARRPVVNQGAIVAEVPIRSAVGNENKVLLEAETTLTKLMNIDEELGEVTTELNLSKEKVVAPVYKGDVLGTMDYYVDGELVGTVNLVATKDYAFDPVKNVLNVIKDIVTSPWLYLPFVLLFIALLAFRQYNYNKRKKQRALARKQQLHEEAEKRRATIKKDQFVEDFLKKE